MRFLTIFIFLMIYFSGAALAAVNDRRVVTWNLQGSSASTESKWNSNIRMVLLGNRDGGSTSDSRRIDVMTIQEAGSLPASITANPALPLDGRLVNPDQVAAPINEYVWNLGSSGRPIDYYVYFSRVDTGANRVNLAILSRERANQVILLRPRAWSGARPILGIRLGSDYYFGIHALANGGTDSGAIVARVWEYFYQNQISDQWLITGDFNREPNQLRDLLLKNYPQQYRNVTFQNEDRPTHRTSGHNLDYGIAGQLNNPFGGPKFNCDLFTPSLMGQLVSDHFPVLFWPKNR
ncbi:Cytolethal distending toxin subunit B homolog [Paraburkholderia ribeironis]|uniref:Cytolethal distending toxin subunit B homolog n=2 Tax=Paraburkholderia ribeironis TaxID=1247936 RepID=A0A1N7RU01_9BURK|nr:Cytolethal distending toxin subunit B homolog [Paraburkholderia ribeironis]